MDKHFGFFVHAVCECVNSSNLIRIKLTHARTHNVKCETKYLFSQSFPVVSVSRCFKCTR